MSHARVPRSATYQHQMAKNDLMKPDSWCWCHMAPWCFLPQANPFGHQTGVNNIIYIYIRSICNGPQRSITGTILSSIETTVRRLYLRCSSEDVDVVRCVVFDAHDMLTGLPGCYLSTVVAVAVDYFDSFHGLESDFGQDELCLAFEIHPSDLCKRIMVGIYYMYIYMKISSITCLLRYGYGSGFRDRRGVALQEGQSNSWGRQSNIQIITDSSGPSVYDDYFGGPYGSFGNFQQADRKESGEKRRTFQCMISVEATQIPQGWCVC